LEIASIPKNLLENMFLGCRIIKNGTVNAYVKIEYYERDISEDIYDHNMKHNYEYK